jgi:hypothetical protein
MSGSSSDYPFARGGNPQQTRLLFPARTSAIARANASRPDSIHHEKNRSTAPFNLSVAATASTVSNPGFARSLNTRAGTALPTVEGPLEIVLVSAPTARAPMRSQ